MLKIKTLLLSAVLALGAAVAVQAKTLATFDITGGTYDIVEGEQIAISGAFAGDASALLSVDPFAPLPLVFGASIDVNGATVLAGDTSVFGPLVLSPAELIGGVGFLLSDLDSSVGGALSAAFDYMAAGLNRTDLNDVFDFGVANLFFSYTGGITGLGTLDGTFEAKIIQTDTSGGTLTDIINSGLADLGLLGVLLQGAAPALVGSTSQPGQPGGFVFPFDDTGTFEASFTIAAVPLPAGLPLLGAGLLGLAWLRRRKTA